MNGLKRHWRWAAASVLIIAVVIATYGNGVFAYAWSIELPVPQTKAEAAQREALSHRSDIIFTVREAPLLILAAIGIALIFRRRL